MAGLSPWTTGAPLRLVIPVKYGIKNLKQVGTLRFTDAPSRPTSWPSEGYDWYAGPIKRASQTKPSQETSFMLMEEVSVRKAHWVLS